MRLFVTVIILKTITFTVAYAYVKIAADSVHRTKMARKRIRRKRPPQAVSLTAVNAIKRCGYAAASAHPTAACVHRISRNRPPHRRFRPPDDSQVTGIRVVRLRGTEK